MRAKVSVQKHWLVLITLLLGLSMALIGCSKLTTGLSKQSTSTAAAPNTLDTNSSADKTIPSVPVTPKDTNNQTLTSSQKVSESGKTTSAKATEKSNTLTISKAKYNQLKYGDTYEKVKGLLGGTGEVVTESGIKGSKDYTATYLCHVKSPSAGEVFLAFKDNKLVNKMEVNLQ
ncbi:DUF3862 domain-containing protein [Desulfosporosinus sp. Sb-LF]|uniref:DUF3862 domain-containing protein n=1 Tax=Desulfosporosinus sp. Sb-LF TaxID=2560027 RepID=UPI00107F72C1|nr:DUF3862 domain-containing protein [Desulfosporosinus sp. Sb-LF]TGE32571.1 DUF3862 domain-containing protein [Desulfosporosinus sp. Sb-LF]